MLTRTPSIRSVIYMLVFFVAAFGLLLFVWQQFGGVTPLQAKGYRVHVHFAQAQNLQPNADPVVPLAVGDTAFMWGTSGEACCLMLVKNHVVVDLVGVGTPLDNGFMASPPQTAFETAARLIADDWPRPHSASGAGVIRDRGLRRGRARRLDPKTDRRRCHDRYGFRRRDAPRDTSTDERQSVRS